MGDAPAPLHDAVVCVGPRHSWIAVRAIRSLLLFSQARSIRVIAASATLQQLRADLPHDPRLQLLDEDRVAQGLTLERVRQRLQARIGATARAGWYFQQFLKMEACRMPDTAGHALLWDSDTVLLHPLTFFDRRGRVCVQPKTEHHAPYFDLIRLLLGLEKQVSHSFISEHLMVKRRLMRRLIRRLGGAAPPGLTWWEQVLASIQPAQLAGSGFSEYETYGTFLLAHAPGSVAIRHLKTRRDGVLLHGHRPGAASFLALMRRGYRIVTFEPRHEATPWPALAHRLLAHLQLGCLSLLRRQRRRRKQAAWIAGVGIHCLPRRLGSLASPQAGPGSAPTRSSAGAAPVPVIVAVPARLASSRLPGKVMADIHGRPMLRHVVERCRRAAGVQAVVVCTDSPAVARAAQGWGVAALLTPEHCSSGSERLAAVLPQLLDRGGGAAAESLVINVQADQPLLDPGIIERMVEQFASRGRPPVLTPVYALGPDKLHDPSVVKVLRAADGRAITFSRSALPHVRDLPPERWGQRTTYWGHVGIYGYRGDVLAGWNALPPSGLEELEKLEQLRLIEAGVPIATFAVDHDCFSVDTAEQLEQARVLLAGQG